VTPLHRVCVDHESGGTAGGGGRGAKGEGRGECQGDWRANGRAAAVAFAVFEGMRQAPRRLPMSRLSRGSRGDSPGESPGDGRLMDFEDLGASGYRGPSKSRRMIGSGEFPESASVMPGQGVSSGPPLLCSIVNPEKYANATMLTERGERWSVPEMIHGNASVSRLPRLGPVR
jgi:hypothetical protein